MWQSPTYGSIPLGEVVSIISRFTAEAGWPYRFIIGTDSQRHGEETTYVSTLVVHRVGCHAIYFYQVDRKRGCLSFQERMFEEAHRSLKVAELFLHEVDRRKAYPGRFRGEIEIHLDVGMGGRTREVVAAIAGMVVGSGYRCRWKPYAFGASSVADRYTR